MIYTIVVENSDKSENREYSINIDPLYKKNNVYDSINIDSTGVVTITRRIGIDTTIGESYILPTPIDTVYGDIDIELYEGINYISLKDDNNTIISVKYIIKNDFTDTYATKIELNSSITQTTESIMTEVNKKVGEEELNSAITQTSDTIMTEVNKKVGNTEVISKINQSAEQITINANKISLDGKSINLTSGDITISSTNFNVDKNGNMTCSNANISGNLTVPSSKAIYIKKSNNNTAMEESSIGISYYDDNGNFIGRYGKYNDSANFEAIMIATDVTRELGIGYLTNNQNTFTKVFAVDGPNNLGYINTKVELRSHEIYFYNQTQGGAWYISGDSRGGCMIHPRGDGSKWFDFLDSGDLSVSGNVYANNISSDGRLKKDIHKSNESAIDIINQIKHRTFKWKKDDKEVKIGYIAQEIEKIEPNFVLKEEIKDENGKIIDYQYYMNMLPILATATKAIQEQQKEIEELKKIIEYQDERIDVINKELNLEYNIKYYKAKAQDEDEDEEIKQYDDENIKQRVIHEEPEPEKIEIKEEK